MKYNAAADWKIGATIRQIPPLTTHLETLVDYAAGPVKVALKQQIITDLQHQFGIQGIAEQAALPETKTLELDTAKGGQGANPDQPVNIEQIATAALRLRFRHEDPLAPYVSGWSDRIVDLEGQQDGALERFSDVIFARLKEWPATPSPQQIEYLNRITDLLGREACISIFSLNYDLLLETALVNAQRPPLIRQRLPAGPVESGSVFGQFRHSHLQTPRQP